MEIQYQKVDDNSFAIITTSDPVVISDLQSQLGILQARYKQISDNFDQEKAQALTEIQTQIDAISTQLQGAVVVGVASAQPALDASSAQPAQLDTPQ